MRGLGSGRRWWPRRGFATECGFASFLALALVCLAAPAGAAVLISVDKSAQRMTVSVDGVKKWNWPVSTGRSSYSTPAGSFTPFRMEEDHRSVEWDDAPMPHSIFFTREGHAIHGSLEVKRLGMPASHGCVRLSPENAASLFALVKAEGVSKTKVVIEGTEPAPAVAKKGKDSKQAQAGDVKPGAGASATPQRQARRDDADAETTGSIRARRAQDPDLEAYTAQMRQRYQTQRRSAEAEEPAPLRYVPQYQVRRTYGPVPYERSVYDYYDASPRPYYPRRISPYDWD